LRRTFIAALALAAIVGTLVIGAAAAGGGPLPAQWREVRAAVARYHSVAQAERAGYSVEGAPCVESPLGTMGFHAVNQALIADPAIDPLRPEILLYAPGRNGQLKLVGIEYFQVYAEGSVAPLVLGRSLDGPMPGHNPVMPVHYDLHVWLAEGNPSGLFAPFNPALSC